MTKHEVQKLAILSRLLKTTPGWQTRVVPNIYTMKDKGFVPNGCSYVPDRLPFAPSVEFAGDWHDWLYFLGGDANAKLRADNVFRKLIRARASECWAINRWRLERMAAIYYEGVRMPWADSHFNWTEGED